MSIPPNTTATLCLPASLAHAAITMNGQAVDGLTHEVESGEYRLLAGRALAHASTPGG